MKIRGVNLGNWLVLEKWMGGSPLASAASADDRGLIDELVEPERYALLKEHYRTYVTQETFAWLARVGCNLVRIPVPYHLFGTAHHPSCVEQLDDALAWAASSKISVLIDLHTVPMSQNGFDNGGYLGLCAWHKDAARIEWTLAMLEAVAVRYAGHPALWGIEPMNEPASVPVFWSNMRKCASTYPERFAASQAIPMRVLRDFYERFFERVRPIVGPDVALVLHDRFELGRWGRFMVDDRYENVWMDTHQYLAFSDHRFKRYDLDEYLGALKRVRRRLERASRHHPVLVGEWSLANHAPYLSSCTEVERQRWCRALADAQIETFDVCGGGCFWSLRVDAARRERWSFSDCVERGWIDLTHNL